MKNNPCCLAEDIEGFVFKRADENANRLCIIKKNHKIIKACIKFLIKSSYHCLLQFIY